MMVGREMALAYPPRAIAPGAPRLLVEDLSSDGRFAGVGFAARAGEVLGLGGIQGNGQSDVVRALFGLHPWTGRVTLDGAAVPLGTPARAIAAGIVYAPAERQREGLFLSHSISREHLAATSPRLGGPRAHPRDARAGRHAGRDRALRHQDPLGRAERRQPVGRQPAEGGTRALDRGRAQGLHLRGPDARRGRRHQARDLPAHSDAGRSRRRGDPRLVRPPRTHRPQRSHPRLLARARRRRGRRRGGDRGAHRRQRRRRWCDRRCGRWRRTWRCGGAFRAGDRPTPRQPGDGRALCRRGAARRAGASARGRDLPHLPRSSCPPATCPTSPVRSPRWRSSRSGSSS